MILPHQRRAGGGRNFCAVLARIRHTSRGSESGSDAIDGQHVRGQAIVHGVLVREANHVVEAVDHDFVQASVDELLVPEEALPILHPLKVGDRDAAGIGENVGYDEDFLLSQNRVGLGGGGAVGAFADDACALMRGALADVMTFS